MNRRERREKTRATKRRAAAAAVVLPSGMSAGDLGMLMALGVISQDVVAPDALGSDVTPAERAQGQAEVRRAMRAVSGDPAAFDAAYAATLAGAAHGQARQETDGEGGPQT
jgi:hypothetical protein